MVTENEACRPSCVTVVYFLLKNNKNTHLLHAVTKWLWKGVGVGMRSQLKIT